MPGARCGRRLSVSTRSSVPGRSSEESGHAQELPCEHWVVLGGGLQPRAPGIPYGPGRRRPAAPRDADALSGGGSRAGRCAARSAVRPCEIRTCHPPSLVLACSVLHGVQFLGLLGRGQPNLDQVERADEPVTDPEAARPEDRVP